jgi:homoserine kinase
VPTTVTVPATTANLGPGFDCLGAALTLYNQFTFTEQPGTEQPGTEQPGTEQPGTEQPETEQPGTEQPGTERSGRPSVTITVRGVNADRVTTGPDNMAYQAFRKFYARRHQPAPSVKIHIDLQVPLARGLGSSATAIVGGLMGANVLAGSPCTLAEIAAMATDIEGHPDNVVPALLGGCRLAATGTDDRAWEICALPWNVEQIVPVVAIPEFELSTSAARQVLPQSYSRADAVFNMAHLGLLIQGLATGNADWLRAALQDRIHQPYRQSLIPGYAAVQAAAIEAGAYGMVISGAGPTLLALASANRSATVAAAMEQAWQTAGIRAQSHCLQLDQQGTQVTR